MQELGIEFIDPTDWLSDEESGLASSLYSDSVDIGSESEENEGSFFQ